ncbi:MAG: M48 family metallopeptidase [Rhodobacteraceae bacterium]|nr:M48 family metallopeptidase [Paracoccaceae bacterium]
MTDPSPDPLFGDFMDGDAARLQRVRISPDTRPGALQLHLPDGETVIDWPLSDLRLIPDQADHSVCVLGLDGDHPARLIIADDALAARLRQLCPALTRRHRDPGIVKRLMILSAAAVSSVALIIFVLVPLMADQLANLLPSEGERALGEATFEQIRTSLGGGRLGIDLCSSPGGDRALQTIADRLKPYTDFPYDIRFHILDHKMVNAFALPGGHIVLFDGLLKDVQSPEELAGIIAHEMGHIEHRDPSRLTLRSAGSIGVLGLLLGDFAGGTVVLFLSERLIQANYSRGAEAAADRYAYEVLAGAGLPSSRMGDFFLRLMAGDEGDGGLSSHLSTHPENRARIDAAIAADMTGGNYTPVLTSAEWARLRGICK